ncbi:macrolide family glycosyltransferase [Streptomonospora sediminis]
MVGSAAISHTLPSLELIRELVRRGHRVTYANDPSLGHIIADTGAEPVPYTTTFPTGGQEWTDDPIEGMEMFLDEAVNNLPAIRAAYENDRPDLFLYDIGGYAARVLGINWDIPAVQLSPSMVAWAGYRDSIMPWLRSLPGADRHFEKFDAWLAENGVHELDNLAFSGQPSRCLALIPREMQPEPDTVADTVTFVGPCLGERADQGSWTRPADAENVLLISLGSAYTNQPDFYRRCLEAFGGLAGWHVVLQIGKYTDPADLGSIPDNVEVHSWVPQLNILHQADAFLTHAGMGGAAEGLYTGTPMIAVPQAVDQFDNADRLQALGVARRIDTADATAQTLRSALLELTTAPETAHRLTEISTRLQASGTPYAADLVEAELPQPPATA